MAKFRNAQSYYGNTEEARKRQRANLIPGNLWQKKRTRELRLDCWWEVLPLGNVRWIYEAFENKRDLEDIPKRELKNSKFLNDWWAKKITIEDKEFIYKTMEGGWKKEDEETLKKDIYECLKEKLAIEKKELKEG